MKRNVDEEIKISLAQDIKIPDSILAKAEAAFEQIRNSEETRAASSFRLKKQIIASAAAILIIITTVGIIHPSIVNAIPGVRSIFKLIGYGNMGESLEKFEQFSTSINKSVEKNGIKITINEVTIDDNILAITSTEEGKNLRENVGYMGHITLNDKLVRSYSSKDKKIDDNTLTTVTYANVSDLSLPNSVDVGLNIVWVGDVKGPWDFKFNISKSDKPTNSRVVSLGNTLKIPGSTLKIDNIVISPLGNTLNYSGKYDEVNGSMKNDIFGLFVMDDKGRNLQTKFGGSSSNKEKYDGKIEILNSLEGIKTLTVIPVFKQWGIKTIDINNSAHPILQTTINGNNFNLPLEIVTKSRPVTEKEKSKGYALSNVTNIFSIDKDRKFSSIDGLVNQVIKVGYNNTVLIKNIEVSEKETKFTFKIEGNGAYTYRNIGEAVIIDEDYNDFKREEDGEQAVLENADEGIVSIKLAPLDKTKKYKIALPIIDEPQIEEKYKINIDLRQ